MRVIAVNASIADEFGSFDRRREGSWMQRECLVFPYLFVLYHICIQEVSDVSTYSGRRRSAKFIPDFSLCMRFGLEIFKNLERGSLPWNAILMVRTQSVTARIMNVS